MTAREELEFLTGKLIQGNITPIVYDIIKESHLLNKEDEVRKELSTDAEVYRATGASCNLYHGVNSFASFLRHAKRL